MATCQEKALELLARRDHFRRELETKLARRGYDPAEVEEVLGGLAERGYLDDARTARQFAAGRLRRSPMGPRKLAAELHRRGVPGDTVEAVLRELVGEDDTSLAREEAERWLARRPADRAALARHLDRKGFTEAAIWRVLDEARLG